MSKTISIGELRQNPTRMPVKAGATYTITDHGEPVAEVAAHRQPRAGSCWPVVARFVAVLSTS